MEEMLKLLNIYKNIKIGIFRLKLILNSLDDDVLINGLSLFEYYNDFSSLNIEEVYSNLKNNVESDKVDEIISKLEVLKEIYDNYGIKNLNELSTIILSYWQNNKIYSDDLIRDVLLIEYEEHNYNDLPKSSVSLLQIYKDMVEYNMITNPNIPIGSSSERLYTMLPEEVSCYESNLKVISNPTIDWSIYINGYNPLEHYIYLYNNSQSEIERRYYHDLIITAISSSCSLFNNRFAWHAWSDKVEEVINYYLLVSTDKADCHRHTIKDIDFINEIHSLLLTDKLFNHQMELYIEKNEEAEEVIKQLKLVRGINMTK